MFNSDGWHRNARQVASPNYDNRQEGAEVSLLVIHNISLPPGEFGSAYICDFFCNQLDCSIHPYFTEIADLQVSAHFLIDRHGEITQFVSVYDRAWHAGQSCFQGVENCNDFSIGIELEGSDDHPYTDKQYRALSQLAGEIMASFPSIKADRIVGHCDIAPGRKTDPGPAFDWQRFRRELNKLGATRG